MARVAAILLSKGAGYGHSSISAMLAAPCYSGTGMNWKHGLDLLALLGIIQGLWGIDVAVFAPQLLMVHWGTYLGLMYLQIGAAGIWLYVRARV